MAASSKRVNGLSIVGFVFAMTGLSWFIVGQTAIGLSQITLGIVFIAAGLAAARRAIPTDESLRPQPPANRQLDTGSSKSSI